jgi:16S rRNA (adenine1518-N6/adenine1519-N6)-dimethyltransferase
MRIKPKKSLGQYFLHSKKVLSEIIAAANIQKDEIVLEIGPGTGILTQELINAGARVIAVEKDSRARELLEEKFISERVSGQLILIGEDILKFDSATVGFENGKYAIVANIPYYITGAILEKFLENEPRPNRMVILTQKEVSDRIVAKDSKESILSISVKAFGNPRIISKVPRSAFVPSPNVDSAILAIDNISNKKFVENEFEIRRFFDIVRAGFTHKRKLLSRNLESIANPRKIKNVWNILSFKEKVRAEDITLEQWFALSTKISA